MSGDHNANQKPKQNMKKLLEVTPAQMERMLDELIRLRKRNDRQETET